MSKLQKLKEKIKKLSERERNIFYGRTYVSMIAALVKRLIQYEGYAKSSTILEREIKKIGRKSAQEIMQKFNFKPGNPERASDILKIIAMLLGFELEEREGETYVKGCPFAILAKERNEPKIAEICSWYCSGIVEEVVGNKYVWIGFHDLQKDPPECHFKHFRKDQVI